VRWVVLSTVAHRSPAPPPVRVSGSAALCDARFAVVAKQVDILRAGVEVYEPRSAALLVEVRKHRFLCNGRLETSVYDPGEMLITYRPARALLDWTALNLYLDSFRSWDGSAEAAVALIAGDLKSVLAPGYLLVELVLPGGSGGYRYSISTAQGSVA
jgi:NADPH-dependent 7-cyano-7-deazaguanine reductase QueF